MKPFTQIAWIAFILLCGCRQNETQSENQSATATTPASPTELSDTVISDDKQELQKLVKQLYQWHQTQSSQNDFEPAKGKGDSAYAGLDLSRHQARMAELRKTGFFSGPFLENYDRIGLAIDKGLKSGKLEWLVGDLPPFGNDANPWCDCQDNPENYWQTMRLNKMKLNKVTSDNGTASFAWTWGKGFNYEVKAVKQKGKWKVSYLQGFDFSEFVPID